MKRKADKQQGAGPVSAFAARKARQQQAQTETVPTNAPQAEPAAEPPSKKPRTSLEGEESTEFNGTETRSSRTRSSKKQKAPLPAETETDRPKRVTRSSKRRPENAALEAQEEWGEEESLPFSAEGPDEMTEDGAASEFPADTPAAREVFALSTIRLNNTNIVYADENTLCVRIQEGMTMVVLGQYDLWVKRGIVSLMGAKLHPSSQVYRVYAPSTHSLPVIKCIVGVGGEAEVELKSCHSGLSRLQDVSPLYQRIWNGQNTRADKVTLEEAASDSRRTFSVLYKSSNDSLKRHLRPLNLGKKWSSSVKALSQRQGRLRVLVCGPKASGKSTFSRFLLNHVLSPAPETENGYKNTDGVAFLDLDPGQPEFAPMGQIYLAHLRSPFFGPPFTHPSLDHARDGQILRAHHIGATSPKEDPDHYALATMDLMDQYRSLLAQYPRCPLIINYPGWIFGQGLEVVTWLVKSLGLSDVVYMSENGPGEVLQPLTYASLEARVPMTILPSQPTDFVSRSSAQLRSMQIQSYFHLSHPADLSNPLWQGTPLSRTRPIAVDYAGPKQGILGIMIMGSQISPHMLREVLEGAVVAVVAVESRSAIIGSSIVPEKSQIQPSEENEEDGVDAGDDMDMDSNEHHIGGSFGTDSVKRTPEEDLPYLFFGSGSCTPLDPKASNCLGLALIHSVNVSVRKLELSTPISSSRLRDAMEQGHELVLVRGQLDSPNWAVSEEYHAARDAERRYQQSVTGEPKQGTDLAQHNQTLSLLRERIRRASNVPWMTVVEDNSRRERELAARRERSLWKLNKKVLAASESETDLV